MNEAETRAELIDPALSAAGWGVGEGSRIRREYQISPGRIEGRGRRGKPSIADYVLEYRNRNTRFGEKQRVFLGFVLTHYATVGVEELDQEKLKPLLRLKYHDSIADAVADLGRPEEIGSAFAGFQKYLYSETA